MKFISIVSAAIFIISCSGEKSKDDFIGVYTIYSGQAIDSTIEHLAGWRIELAEKNNFEIINPGNRIGGYWDITGSTDEGYNLLLQSGGMKANAIIKDNSIYFSRPYKMLDSIFRFAEFKKTR